MAAVQLSRPRLTLVTHQTWRAEDLAPWADVHLDFGLDTAAGADAEAMLWCPGGWAAAATLRHRQLQLSSAGPRWLDYLPIELTGREIVATEAGVLQQTPPVISDRRVFAKLPETKHDSFPAQLRTLAELRRDLSRLPDHEPVQLQSPVRFDSEVRCWVRDGRVVARAGYFPDQARERWPDLDDPVRATAAVLWLEEALVACHVPVPPAVVIDVGWCSDPWFGQPGWRIVEANAAWSADWYGAVALSSVVETVIASQVGVSDRWRWYPSPLLLHLSSGLAQR